MCDTTRKNTVQKKKGQPPDILKGFWTEFERLIGTWRPSFHQGRTFERTKKTILGLLACPGRATITNSIVYRGLEQEHWSPDYECFSRASAGWTARDLFKWALLEGVKETPTDSQIVIALDDTGLPKWGTAIPQVGWIHNGMAPKFLDKPICRGMRMLHAALLIPTYVGHRPLAVSVAFEPAPAAPKPKKKAQLTEEQLAEYEVYKKECSLPRRASRLIKVFREVLDQAGYQDRKLLLVVDGSYTCSEVVRNLPERTNLVGRFRKNAKLRSPVRVKTGKTIYGDELERPESIRTNAEYPEMRMKCHYGRGLNTIKNKQIYRVYWPEGTRNKLMRMIILTPAMKSKSKAKRKPSYTQPAYLLTTDLTTETTELIQAYGSRWQIEQLHRDGKNGLGIGQVQAYSEQANERVHGAQMAGYSMLLLAAHRAFGGERAKVIPNLPKWRKTPPERISVDQLVGLLRNALHRSNYFKRNQAKKLISTPKGVAISSSLFFQVA